MNQFSLYFNQISNICIWLNTNTKIKCGIIYDSNSIHIEIVENDKVLYEHHIDDIKVKNESIVFHDMKRLITYLLNLKQEQDENN